jgi:hypothetical protein
MIYVESCWWGHSTADYELDRIADEAEEAQNEQDTKDL